jgi:hypothetical protein
MRFRRSLPGLAVLTMVGLSLTAGLLVAVPVLRIVTRKAMLGAFNADTFTYGELARFNSASADIGRLQAVLPFVGTVSFLLFVGWLYRVRRDLEERDSARLAWGWGWTVVGWLVPVANLVVPPVVVAEVARSSQFDAPSGRS